MQLRKIENKKGQINLEVVSKVMVTFMVLAVIAIAVVLALVSLRDSSIFTDGTLEANQTDNLVANVTSAVTDDFFSNTGTIFSILVVVVIISAIAIVILAVRNFGSGAGAGGL